MRTFIGDKILFSCKACGKEMAVTIDGCDCYSCRHPEKRLIGPLVDVKERDSTALAIGVISAVVVVVLWFMLFYSPS